MPAQEVARRFGPPKVRRSAESIWGPAAAAFFKDPDIVEAWLYDLVELDKSLMVIVESGRVHTLNLQRL